MTLIGIIGTLIGIIGTLIGIIGTLIAIIGHVVPAADCTDLSGCCKAGKLARRRSRRSVARLLLSELARAAWAGCSAVLIRPAKWRTTSASQPAHNIQRGGA